MVIIMLIDKTFVKPVKRVRLKDPVLIEGLPGIGLVGKLVADLLIEQYKGVKIAEVYSPHLPHQVNMNKDGVITPTVLELYRIKVDKRDFIVLVGDVQPSSSEAQYEVNGRIVEYCKKLGCKEIITLGGYATGVLKPKIKVHGAATDDDMVKRYSKYGVVFGKAKGAIIGAAGLLILLGKMNGIPGVCLMGETHGGFIDPKAALNLIEVLKKSHNIEVNTEYLDKIAKANEELLKELEEAEKDTKPDMSGLSYFR